ncbi:MAG: DNA repair protein RadA, partial [Candidatus Theseobacter exili]|nr:DNA repair protein RadA [Candidatus Theseobacter exili]
GEESITQVKVRSNRLNIQGEGIVFLSENNLEKIERAVDSVNPEFLIIDSIQSVFIPEIASVQGSLSQIRECGGRLMALSKGRGIATFLVGHVTKEGFLAGPKILEHMVDAVVYIEGEKQNNFRILRAVKNRYGSVDEIGIFQMKENGLEEVLDPSGIFLSNHLPDQPGTVIVPSIEGSRPILVEIQALVTRSNFGVPKRMVSGLDYNRMCLMIAVLEKRLHTELQMYDVFLNVPGGVRVNETAMDLGVVLAMTSSFREQPVPAETACFGEIGLAGEIRGVTKAEQRIAEALKLGFKRCIIPGSNLEEASSYSGPELVPVNTVEEAVKAAFSGDPF